MIKRWTSLLFWILMAASVSGQTSLLDLVDQEEETYIVDASFKTNRIINLHSLENTAPGVLDFKIGHRFGFINDGIQDLFGLDNATIRLGLDLGLTERLMIGVGRSSFEKTYDGFIKYKLLRQTQGAKSFPFTMALFASMAVKTNDFENPNRENFFSSRLFYAFQGIIGRKFSDGFSMQLSPTMIHRNLVETVEEEHNVFALGLGLRQKLSKRLSLNLEYVYVPEGQILDRYNDAFSVGFDIETGGHVFQLHFTNATSMIEKGFVAETTGSWTDMGVHFGFNISRVFTLWNRPSKGL